MPGRVKSSHPAAPTAMMQETYHFIGQLGKPKGLDGSLSLSLLEGWDLSTSPTIYFLQAGSYVPYSIADIQGNGKNILLQLKGIENRTAATLLQKASCYVTASMFNKLENKRTKKACIHYQVIDQHNNLLGTIAAEEAAKQATWEVVDASGKKIRLPKAMSEGVNHATKQVTVTLPEGFLDLFT